MSENLTIIKNADNLLFRASSMGDIMTGVAKGWDVDKSLTCKRKLVQMYRELTWNKRHQLKNKYVEKGTGVEDDSITLYCRVKKQMFKKNDIRLNNEFFSGEVDLFIGLEIRKAERIIDIKSCWDWTTLPSICDEVDSGYDYQGQTYMDLTGAGLHTVASCLVNTPAKIILDEKNKLRWKHAIIDIETEEYINACIEVEKNHIHNMELFIKDNPSFDFHSTDWQSDVPLIECVHEMDVVRDDAKIQRMKERITEARWWMNKNLFKTK